MRSTRVVIADRYPVILQGLIRVLEVQQDFQIVAHCEDGASCIKAIQNFVPDIAILDVSMPDIAGLEILASSQDIPTRVVFFTASVEERDLRILAAAGAHAVIPKDVDPGTLVQILRQVARGERWLQLPSSQFRERNVKAEKAVVALTERERQIMRLVCKGLSNKEIGRRLHIADGTIKVHLHHIFQKLEIGNRTALAALAISNEQTSGNRGAGDQGRGGHLRE